MDQRPPQQHKTMPIELGEKESEGTYANLAVISYSPSEFILDFARRMPGAPKAKVYSRIVMAPGNVALLMRALEQNLKAYEEKFGRIRLDVNEEPRDIGFRGSDPRDPRDPRPGP